MKANCPHCGQHLEVPNEYLGLQVACPTCSNEFVCNAPIASQALPQEKTSQSNSIPEAELLKMHPSGMVYLHWFIFGGIFIVSGIPIFFTGSAGTVLGWCSVTLGAIMIVGKIISRACTTYVITTKRIIASAGVINRKQREVYISDIRAVNFETSLWQRIIGIGTIGIGTAATAGLEININGVANPQSALKLINSLRGK